MSIDKDIDMMQDKIEGRCPDCGHIGGAMCDTCSNSVSYTITGITGSDTFTIEPLENRDFYVRVRDAIANPIKPFTINTTVHADTPVGTIIGIHK
jgi:hypothetical protein